MVFHVIRPSLQPDSLFLCTAYLTINLDGPHRWGCPLSPEPGSSESQDPGLDHQGLAAGDGPYLTCLMYNFIFPGTSSTLRRQRLWWSTTSSWRPTWPTGSSCSTAFPPRRPRRTRKTLNTFGTGLYDPEPRGPQTLDPFSLTRPQSLLAGMNRFLSLLEITFRRDPNNFRPRINKLNSIKVRLFFTPLRGFNHSNWLQPAVSSSRTRNRRRAGTISSWTIKHPSVGPPGVGPTARQRLYISSRAAFTPTMKKNKKSASLCRAVTCKVTKRILRSKQRILTLMHSHQVPIN